MSALVTLAAAKQHLRVDHTDDDEDIQRKIDQASDIVLDYIKRDGTTPPAPDGTIAAIADFADGLGIGPTWSKLTFTTVTGTAAAIEAGDLRVTQTGTVTVEFHATVTTNKNRSIILGSGWDGDEPLEHDRFKVYTDDPTGMFLRVTTELEAGGLLALYLACDNPVDFQWEAGNLALIFPSSEPAVVAVAPRGAAWGPGTVPKPVEAAVFLMLSKLYDDRNAGKEDNENVALGYLTPAITALLHRFRDPALA